MNEENTIINYMPEQPIPSLEKPIPTKPRKPKPINKPRKPKPPLPTPEPITQEPSKSIQEAISQQDFQEQIQKQFQELQKEKPITPEPKKSIFFNPNQPKETMGYDTLNPFIYKFTNYLLLPSILCFIVLLICTIINFVFFPTLIWNLYGFIICTVFSLITFILLFLMISTSLKKNDLIIIRKFRSGAGTISRINLKGKSEILFDKKDPASKVLISWAGAITDVISGCRIIQISEGHPTNDNLNAQVTESEWDRDVSRLTKAKSVADLAEAELFNQGLFGLKWQDIVLIIIGLICLGTLGYLVLGLPDAIAQKTMESLMNGTLQNAITTGVQQTLSNAGILTPIVTP